MAAAATVTAAMMTVTRDSDDESWVDSEAGRPRALAGKQEHGGVNPETALMSNALEEHGGSVPTRNGFTRMMTPGPDSDS